MSGSSDCGRLLKKLENLKKRINNIIHKWVADTISRMAKPTTVGSSTTTRWFRASTSRVSSRAMLIYCFTQLNRLNFYFHNRLYYFSFLLLCYFYFSRQWVDIFDRNRNVTIFTQNVLLEHVDKKYQNLSIQSKKLEKV